MAEPSFEAAGHSEQDAPTGTPAPARLALPTFKELYHRYFDFVWASARRLGVEPSAMDDTVQEVFIVIHSKLHTLEKPEALRSWIYGVVRRTASNHRRMQRANAGPSAGAFANEEPVSREPTPLEQTERNSELLLLTSLLDQLDEPKREIFSLVELEELPVPEAAEVLEIPLNTAYSRLRAARQMFEAALARCEARNKGT
jgi:RNA polymerase sigma-70 factor (ECF subfamily)